jgi:hypothetical protein
MLYRETIAVCSQIHTKHINTLCGQNVELLNVKLAVHIVTTKLTVHIVTTTVGTYSDHWAMKGTRPSSSNIRLIRQIPQQKAIWHRNFEFYILI